MSGDQLRRLKELEKENERLRRAVSDLTLDKQILKEAAHGPEGPGARARVNPSGNRKAPAPQAFSAQCDARRRLRQFALDEDASLQALGLETFEHFLESRRR